MSKSLKCWKSVNWAPSAWQRAVCEAFHRSSETNHEIAACDQFLNAKFNNNRLTAKSNVSNEIENRKTNSNLTLTSVINVSGDNINRSCCETMTGSIDRGNLFDINLFDIAKRLSVDIRKSGKKARVGASPGESVSHDLFGPIVFFRSGTY